MNRKRLEKIITHLESGRPKGSKKFTFSTLSVGPITKQHCGTNGCVMGDFPVIFPRHFVVRQGRYETSDNDVFLLGGTATVTWGQDLLNFLDIEYGESRQLFWPTYYNDAPWNQSNLAKRPDRLTAKQVAKAIRRFIKWKDTNAA